MGHASMFCDVQTLIDTDKLYLLDHLKSLETKFRLYFQNDLLKKFSLFVSHKLSRFSSGYYHSYTPLIELFLQLVPKV